MTSPDYGRVQSGAEAVANNVWLLLVSRAAVIGVTILATFLTPRLLRALDRIDEHQTRIAVIEGQVGDLRTAIAAGYRTTDAARDEAAIDQRLSDIRQRQDRLEIRMDSIQADVNGIERASAPLPVKK